MTKLIDETEIIKIHGIDVAVRYNDFNKNELKDPLMGKHWNLEKHTKIDKNGNITLISKEGYPTDIRAMKIVCSWFPPTYKMIGTNFIEIEGTDYEQNRIEEAYTNSREPIQDLRKGLLTLTKENISNWKSLGIVPNESNFMGAS